MKLLDLLTRVAGPTAAGRLRERLQHEIEARLDERGLATEKELERLALHLAHARTALDELGDALAVTARGAAAIAAAPPPEPYDHGDVALRLVSAVVSEEAIADRVARITEGLQATGDAGVSARAATSALAERITAAEAMIAATEHLTVHVGAATADPAPIADPHARTCKVPGCSGKFRARGLCGKHYQMYTRRKLPGVVLEDGVLLFEDGHELQLDPSLAGEVAIADTAGWTVAGQRVG